MRKINLENYTVKLKVPDKMNSGLEIEAEFPYNVKDSLVNVLFVRELGLNGVELVKANMLAQKILACEANEILLEETEWQRLQTAINTAQGFGRPDIEFVRRINEAEVVEVKSK